MSLIQIDLVIVGGHKRWEVLLFITRVANYNTCRSHQSLKLMARSPQGRVLDLNYINLLTTITIVASNNV